MYGLVVFNLCIWWNRDQSCRQVNKNKKDCSCQRGLIGVQSLVLGSSHKARQHQVKTIFADFRVGR